MTLTQNHHYRLVRTAAIYFALMGTAPLMWPKHDTWIDPHTWLDWALHLGGLFVAVRITWQQHRLRRRSNHPSLRTVRPAYREWEA